MRFNTAVNSSGTVDIGGGALTGTGSYTQTGGTFLLSGGTVQLNNALNFQGGSGRRARVTHQRSQSKQRAAAACARRQRAPDHGNVSLLSSSQLVFQIGGDCAGQQYGFMNVSGNVSLGGQLVLSFVNGFQNAVSPNDTFTLMTSSQGVRRQFCEHRERTAAGDQRRLRLVFRQLQRQHTAADAVAASELRYVGDVDRRQRQLE
jgi:hypothetical protein